MAKHKTEDTKALASSTVSTTPKDYRTLVTAIEQAHDRAQQQAVQAVNVALTLRNWLIGYHIVEYEQHGSDRAKYGERLLDELARDLKKRIGKGFTKRYLVLIEEEKQAQAGRRCRVLGKAGADVGSATIDQWLYQDVLRQNERNDADDDVRQMSRALLVECEQAKERLSSHERAEVSVMGPNTGAVLSAEFTRSQFEDLLDEHETFTKIDQTIRRVMNVARERGYTEEHIQAVLMVGGSSLIPSVQQTVRRIFGRERVMLNHPLDAVARGAAAFVAGVDFYDHIQHDYAIRFVNPKKGNYDYRIIVTRGTPYPTKEPVALLTIKATYDGQSQLGIAIFEMGEQRQRGSGQPVELVFDPSGAARMVNLTPDEEDRRIYFWMNERSPTFLLAEPPAKQGERRFQVEFSVDGNKRLLITARDLKTERLTHRDYPVVKLT